MSVSWWVAHVLALHLSVPEPVTVNMVPSLYPSTDWAQVRRVPEAIRGGGWVVDIDSSRWAKMDNRGKMWLVAHELCHAAYGDDQVEWGRLSRKQQQRRHRHVINPCADKILRDHSWER